MLTSKLKKKQEESLSWHKERKKEKSFAAADVSTQDVPEIPRS
jgi:hypothetical protein